MGPGPSNVHYRVYQAMLNPVIGYLDPQLLATMDDISEMLRSLFQTKHRLTLAISATGSSGMEASFANFIEPGDIAIDRGEWFFFGKDDRSGFPMRCEDHPGRSGLGKDGRT